MHNGENKSIGDFWQEDPCTTCHCTGKETATGNTKDAWYVDNLIRT